MDSEVTMPPNIAEEYMSCSKINIDNYIRTNEYRKAFRLLILCLERLNGEEKAQVIDYYSNNFPSR